MNIKYVFIAILLFVSGCVTNPIPTDLMLPRPQAYIAIPDNYYFKGKVAVGTIRNESTTYHSEKLFNNYATALQRGLSKAKMLATNQIAQYVLSAEIKDLQKPDCKWGTCETGSAVAYHLTNQKGEEVYHELIVVPFTSEYSTAEDSGVKTYYSAVGGAMAENIAQLIQTLTRKSKVDFKQ